MVVNRRSRQGDSLLNPLLASTRQQLVTQAILTLESLIEAVQTRLSELMDEPALSREMQIRRDAWMSYQKYRQAWHDATVQAWRDALSPASRRAPMTVNGAFELLGTEAVENKIVASRLALDLMEKAAKEVNDLRRRIKSLNGEEELGSSDIVHPEALILPLVEQWSTVGLTQEIWQLVSDTVRDHLVQHLPEAYALCNAELTEQGVMPAAEFTQQASVKRAAPVDEVPSAGSDPVSSGYRRRAADRVGSDVPPAPQAGVSGGGTGPGFNGSSASAGGRGSYGLAQGLMEQVGRLLAGGMLSQAGQTPPTNMVSSAGNAPLPMGPAQQAFGNAPPPVHSATTHRAPSLTVLAALDHQPVLDDAYFQQTEVALQLAAPVVLQRVVDELRQQSAEVKGQAETDNEKAIIEVVTLMFQSILQEDRIPTGVRVWFARLQMPVLRVALADPEFFNSADHPARKLIDHMGSCVMGFDASGISGAALETEIKRIVQVIEQYPETGERVYRNVYDEFQAFLKRHLTEKPATQKVMGVAEQVELKETLTIQYTIELRNQIKDMPVRAEIREFLFKVWAEVLAVSAVRQGAKHAETLLLKKTASDLIWAASAKPSRTDRAKVIANLPELLRILRLGMQLLGTVRIDQEAHITRISDTLADAFMSKTQAIDDEMIQALAARLANLEDYVSDDGLEELPLDASSIEELLGIETSGLEVVNVGGGSASAAMLALATQLTLGAWFVLDLKGQVTQVQYVWRSPLGHLHLFASSVGSSYLIQTVRLAAYLQSGLLKPQEDESLTMRATRSALGKLEANPDLLLA